MGIPAKLTFRPSSAFHTELKAEVDAYFERTGHSRHANAEMYLKAAFWLSLTWGTYALILSNAVSFPLSLLLWGVFGFGLACIGFNIGHDSIHEATSKRRWVNRIFGYTFDMMGASSQMWRIQHNLIHHTFTNVAGVDDDIEPGPTLRFYARPDVKWFHRYQHFYGWGLYALVGILWMYHKDFFMMLRVDPRTGKRSSNKDIAYVFVSKAAHLVLLVGIPLLVLPNTSHVLAGYLVGLLSGGFTLAIVFQLAHVVEGPTAPRAIDNGTRVDDGWADHQMRTTANFGKTWLSTFMTGGLDHQIEHHLFPRICHTHYPKLAPIVKACAERHGLPYYHSGSFFDALASHYRVMRAFGRGEAPAVVMPLPTEPAFDRAAE